MSQQLIFGTPAECFARPQDWSAYTRFERMPILVDYVDGHLWRLAHDVRYTLEKGQTSTVRAGFLFDWASIPRLFWRILPPAGAGRNRYGIAALWHDWLYVHQALAGKRILREEADDLFLEIMLYVNVRPFVASLMHRAVRIGGGLAWARNARKIRLGGG
jgi:hypothetical protein